MTRFHLIFALLFTLIFTSAAAAQSDQCYIGYFGETICPSSVDFPPDSGAPIWPGVSSGGMLPPPDCTLANPCPAPCIAPTVPPEPAPRIVYISEGGSYLVYPVLHTYVNTQGCEYYAWEFPA